jgi:hypothetical protein
MDDAWLTMVPSARKPFIDPSAVRYVENLLGTVITSGSSDAVTFVSTRLVHQGG